jgi:hypothetical protein
VIRALPAGLRWFNAMYTSVIILLNSIHRLGGV